MVIPIPGQTSGDGTLYVLLGGFPYACKVNMAPLRGGQPSGFAVTHYFVTTVGVNGLHEDRDLWVQPGIFHTPNNLRAAGTTLHQSMLCVCFITTHTVDVQNTHNPRDRFPHGRVCNLMVLHNFETAGV